MSILEKLASASVVPVADSRRLEYVAYAPTNRPNFDRYRTEQFHKGIKPLVSCLMVTRGDRRTLSHALECYRRQQYPNRELIIVTDLVRIDAVTDAVLEKRISGAAVFGLGPELKLGDLRNVSVARARGEVLMQWDDDDLYDPLRITTAMAVLTQSPASAAALLGRVLLWWPERKLAAISPSRLWEGSMAVWREHSPVYPSLRRGEDTVAIKYLSESHPITLYESPLIYVYTIHGENTWDTQHFVDLFDQSTCVFSGDEYDRMIELLSPRLPMREYADAIAQGGAAAAG